MANFNYDQVPKPFLKTVVEHVQYLASERMREDDVHYVGSNFRHGNNNGSIDYSSPILKPIVYNTYPIFVIQYTLLSIFSICSNLLIVFYVMRFKLYRDVTQAFLINLSLCYFLQSIVVLPLSLTILLIQNWIFGQFLCFFLPMLQVSIYSIIFSFEKSISITIFLPRVAISSKHSKNLTSFHC
jgi:hypothetical protein